MFIKLKASLISGKSISDKYKLVILAAYTSRPKWKKYLKQRISAFTKNGLITLELNPVGSNNRSLNVCLRTDHFDSDYLSMYELLLINCYRLPIRGFNPELIVDGGANTGLFTLLNNKIYPTSKILLFEPVEGNLNLIKEHLKINNSKAEIYEGILSSSEGNVKFYIRNANNSSFDSVQPYQECINIFSYNLPNELKKFKANNILIKLDIEGSEIEVIPDLLDGVQNKALYIIGELHNWPLHLDSLRQTAFHYGYILETYAQDSNCLLFHLYKRSSIV